MSQIDDGGSAFPAEVYLTPRDTIATKCPGMTLRDWFAGQALTGMIPIEYAPNGQINSQAKKHALVVASHAYNIADAMLAARLTKPE